MKPVPDIYGKATELISHRRGIGRSKHMDKAYLPTQDEVRSKRVRVRRVKSEENVAELGTKPLRKAVIAKHTITLEYANMAEERVEDAQQDVAMSWDIRSVPIVRDWVAGRAAPRRHQVTVPSNSVVRRVLVLFALDFAHLCFVGFDFVL